MTCVVDCVLQLLLRKVAKHAEKPPEPTNPITLTKKIRGHMLQLIMFVIHEP